MKRKLYFNYKLICSFLYITCSYLIFPINMGTSSDISDINPLDFTGLTNVQSDGRFPTLNNMGWIIDTKDPYSNKFIEFSIGNDVPSLEIGAGFGFTSFKVLQGGGKIIVNDICKHHIEVLEKNIPEKYKKNLELKPGKFPEELYFEKESLSSILASRVLHFYNEEEVENAARIMFDLIVPGGKVFIIVDSPYLQPWAKFIEIFEQRKESGCRYPGIVMNPQEYNPVSAQCLPPYIHFFDPPSLSQPFKEAGFMIEKAEFFKREDYPIHVQLDGREGVGLIAVKPTIFPNDGGSQ